MPLTMDDLAADSSICKITSEKEIDRQTFDAILVTRRKRDVITPLRLGKDWLYELTVAHQPRTGRILLNGGELFLLRFDSFEDGNNMYALVQEVNGRLIEIVRQPMGDNMSEHNIERYYGRDLSLPDSIRLAYYHRFDGLSAPDEVIWGFQLSHLPFPISAPWWSVDGYLASLKLKKKYLPLLEEMIPDIRPSNARDPYSNFMMFLDARFYTGLPDDKKGDVLFVKTHIQDKVVYHMKNGDVPNMRILADPTEAIDRYCEHVLLRKEGRFDFLPYTTEFTG